MAIAHWKHGISDLFEVAGDWSTNTVPGANDDVAIDAAGTYTVTVSASHTVRSLRTVSIATLDVIAGRLTITHGTGTGANAGTITVEDGAALAIGGIFNNRGKIELNSGARNSALVIATSVTLGGGGEILLGGTGHDGIGGNRVLFPFFPPLVTFTNLDNTIHGAGIIGTNLNLVNEATIVGDSPAGALTINTGRGRISNSGLMEGTTPEGLIIVSNVANSGTLQAFGENARLVIDGTITNSGLRANVTASGSDAHVELSSAAITGGVVRIGSGAMVESDAGSGLSVISGGVTGSGTLQANQDSTLRVTSGTGTITLIANGQNSILSIGGVVGAANGTISGGEIEFKSASTANITFAPGQVGVLLGTSFAGTVAGFAGNQAVTFSNLFAFGDSTVDSGALQYLSPDLPNPPNPGLTTRLQRALAAGGTDSPVGVGSMNSQILAADFGLAADTAYTTGGGIGGIGTNYAISGALDAPDAAHGNDPGNGNISNINQHGQTTPNPQVLSTVGQISAYLNSVGGRADPSALYLVSSGGNDVSYANRFIMDPAQRTAYLASQAGSLAAEIELLSRAGAEHVIVNTSMSPQDLAVSYSQQLFSDLDAAGIAYTKSDVNAMEQDVIANPTAHGFTSSTVHPGVTGLQTESAFIEVDQTHNLQGWGLWGANTTSPDNNPPNNPPPTNQQYAYLSSPDAEQTHFFSDDQHLSDAGQHIQANLDLSLLTDDAIDLTSLQYVPGNTTASFSGDTSSGTLTVTATNGSTSTSAQITLLGNYMAAHFATAGDGLGGTLVLDQTNPSPQLLAATHG